MAGIFLTVDQGRLPRRQASVEGMMAVCAALEHDPEKWAPVFRKDHAQTKR
jgi:hypothetical protein